jgi:hypothetical protein
MAQAPDRRQIIQESAIRDENLQMIKTLAEKIRDNRFLRLMRNMLRAGYLEDWRWNATLSGVPQGALCEASHKEPYEQRWVMRSARRSRLVGAVSMTGRCA